MRMLTILFLSSMVTFVACNDSGKKSSETDNSAESEVFTPIQTQPSNQAPTEPAQNTDGVWHYTCSKGCAGGAGSAVKCATCGNLLVHNTAYHPSPKPAASIPTNTTDPMTIPPPKAPEPAQNAAGVWHYTCATGCPGGAGAAGACGNCGGALAHNPVYHR